MNKGRDGASWISAGRTLPYPRETGPTQEDTDDPRVPAMRREVERRAPLIVLLVSQTLKDSFERDDSFRHSLLVGSSEYFNHETAVRRQRVFQPQGGHSGIFVTSTAFRRRVDEAHVPTHVESVDGPRTLLRFYGAHSRGLSAATDAVTPTMRRAPRPPRWAGSIQNENPSLGRLETTTCSCTWNGAEAPGPGPRAPSPGFGLGLGLERGPRAP